MKAPLPPLVISATGVATAVGNDSKSLLAACMTGESCMRLHPSLAAFHAPVIDLDSRMSFTDRCVTFFLRALPQVLEPLRHFAKPPRIKLVCLTPPRDAIRSMRLSSQALAAVCRQFSEIEDCDISFVPYDEFSLSSFAEYRQALVSGQYAAVLLGAVDSLVDMSTLQSLAEDKKILTEHNSQGVVPGEGAVFVLLSQADDIHMQTPSSIQLLGVGEANEPKALQADRELMTGLEQAIRQALSDVDPKRLNSLVRYDFPLERFAYEWTQVQRKLWPRGGSDKHSPPNSMNLHSVVGYLGAANFLLAVALACERLHYPFPAMDRVLVCGMTDRPLRRSLLLGH